MRHTRGPWSVLRARHVVVLLAARALGGCYGLLPPTSSFTQTVPMAYSRPAPWQPTPPRALVTEQRVDAIELGVSGERISGLPARAMSADTRRTVRAMIADAGCAARPAAPVVLRAVTDDRGVIEAVALFGADDALARCADRALRGRPLMFTTPEQAVFVTRPFERDEPAVTLRDADMQRAAAAFVSAQRDDLAACRDVVAPDPRESVDVALHLTLGASRVVHAATVSVGEPQRALGRCVARIAERWAPDATFPAAEIILGRVSVRVPPSERAFAHPHAPPEPLRLEPAQSLTLPSGLRAGVLPVPGTVRVAVRLRVAAGDSDDPPGRGGLAHLAEHLVMRSTRATTGSVIDALDALAVTWNARTLPTFTEFEVDATGDQLEAVLRALAPLLAHPLDALDAATLATEQGVVRAEVHERVTESAFGEVPFQVSQALFPEGHREREAAPSLQAISSLTADDLRAFTRRWYRPGFAWLTVAGDVDPGATRALLEQTLRDLPPGDAADPRAPVAMPTLPPAPAVDVPLSVRRDQLAMLWMLPGVLAPEHAAHRVMIRWLDERLGAAVAPSLADRLDVGLTPRASVSTLWIVAEVSATSSTPDLAAAVFQSLPRARAEGITDDDLARWRDAELRALARSARDPAYLAEWFPVAPDVADPAGLRAREAALRALTPQAVLAAYDRWVAAAQGRTFYVRARP